MESAWRYKDRISRRVAFGQHRLSHLHTMLAVDDLDYDLPAGLIATRPATPRDSARLLVVSRSDTGAVEHRTVRDLPSLLGPGDIAVFNRSRVLRARVQGRRTDTGGAVDGLFLEATETGAWRVLLRSGGRLHKGVVVSLLDARQTPTDVTLTLLAKDDSCWLVQPEPAAPDPEAALERVGSTPLPPYILHERRRRRIVVDDCDDRARYQTVYAMGGGSVAAPTAGLHFTNQLLSRLDQRGVRRLHVDLHVGWGTFQPVRTEHVEEHAMHSEWCSVGSETINALRARRAGRLFAIGTTTARALESVPESVIETGAEGWSGSTRLLVTPGYSWRLVEGMLTNFHLPRSTLLAMVAALFDDGVERLLAIYRIAIEARYRFYSYGDAMLILP